MLRKTYRLMQNTKGLIKQTGDQVLRFTGTAEFIEKHQSRKSPSAFACCPALAWDGDVDRGAELTHYISTHSNDELSAVFGPTGYKYLDPMFHSFGWLYDLRAHGTPDAQRAAARACIAWVNANNIPSPSTWAPHLMATRLVALTGTYGFYIAGLTPEENTVLADHFFQQAQLIKKQLPLLVDPILSLQNAAALAVSGIALACDPSWIEQGFKVFEKQIATLILADGGPHTRNPQDLAKVIRVLIDVRGILEGAGLPVPSYLAHALDRAVPALRFFRFQDGKLAIFHGGDEGQEQWLNALLEKSGVNGRAPASLPYAGFERMKGENTVLIMDTGVSPLPGTHASTGAFELAIGPDRMVVGCGQHSHDPMWQDLLSATSAHSTLTLDHQDNITDPARASIQVGRNDTESGTVVEVTHDGYMTRNGFNHTRRIFVTSDGADIRGEDILDVTIPPVMPMPYTIRFHLHPRVSVAMTESGDHAWLRLPSGSGWRFAHTGGTLSLEDSVYLGETGLPQKTKQLVITGSIHGANAAIQWAFQGE